MGNGNKWPGYNGEDVSVGDELAFDALPIETRQLAERVVGMRAGDGADKYDDGYEDGKERGQKLAEEASADAMETLRRTNEAQTKDLLLADKTIATHVVALLDARETIAQLKNEIKGLRRQAKSA